MQVCGYLGIMSGGSWLSLMPFRKKGKSQVRRSGQLRYHQIKWASSLVAVPNDLPLPPAMKKQSKSDRTPMIPRVTHTHTHSCLGFTTSRQPRTRKWLDLMANVTLLISWPKMCILRSGVITGKRDKSSNAVTPFTCEKQTPTLLLGVSYCLDARG